jgi:hypothetical protein
MTLIDHNGIWQEISIRRSVGGSVSDADLADATWAVYAQDGSRLTVHRPTEAEAIFGP